MPELEWKKERLHLTGLESLLARSRADLSQAIEAAKQAGESVLAERLRKILPRVVDAHRMAKRAQERAQLLDAPQGDLLDRVEIPAAKSGIEGEAP